MALSLNLSTQNIQHQIGAIPPTAQQVTLYYGGLLANNYPYDDFRVRFYLSDNWITLSGGDITSDNNLDPTGISVTVNVDLSNLDSLPVGSNNGYISFVIEGLQSLDYGGSGQWEIIDSIEHYIFLNITEAQNVSTDKFIYEIQYVKSTNTFSGQTLISLVNNTRPDNFSVELIQSASYFAISSNSFTDNANIIAGSQLSQLGAVTINPLGIIAKLKDASGNVVYNFSLKVIILENDDIVASISNVELEIVKSKSETKSLKFNLSNPSGKSFSISAPSFITVTPNSGNSNNEITITTVNSSSLNLGDYNGNIVITYDTSKSIIIPVSLSVINFTSSELSSDFNFCLDKKLLKFYKIDTNGVFVRANLSITFKTPTEIKTIDRTYVVPYFNGKAEMDLGARLQSYFLKYVKNILTEAIVANYFNQKIWYYPASISGTVEELDANYVVKNSETLSNIKFFAGKKPIGYPVLTNNLIRRRSENSKVIFPFISGVTDINDFGANFSGFAVVPEKVAVVLKTEVSDQLFTWPTIKEFNIGSNPIKIYTLANNNQSINIAFYNGNLVPDWLTITGDFKISDDYVHTISRNVISGNEEKFDSEKTKTLTINSGFLLKSELNILDEIAASKLIFIEINGKYYKGILNTTKIGKEDSTEELISRDLEFLIVEA